MMSLKERIDKDLKAALLAGEKDKVTTLRGLKGTILNAEIAGGKRDEGLNDDDIVAVLQKEAKKRQESADLYSQGGDKARTDAELTEKAIIEAYLPAQPSDDEISKAADKVIVETGVSGMQAMGEVIGRVKQELGPAADGAAIARIVRGKLS